MSTDLEEPLPANYLKVRSDANRAAQKKFIRNWTQKEMEIKEISKDEWHGPKPPDQSDIVGGSLYPSCVACYEGNKACTWMRWVIESRMHSPNSDGPSCENCGDGDAECGFVWSLLDPMHKIEDAMDRLIRHAASEYRKLERRTEENDAARERMLAALAKLM